MATQPYIATFKGRKYRMRPKTWSTSSFNDGVDNGSAAGTAGDPLEVAVAEVGSDNDMAPFDIVQFGQPADDSRKAGAVTEWDVKIHSDAATEVGNSAEFRIEGAFPEDRGGNPIFGYEPYRKLSQATPSEQIGIPRLPSVVFDGQEVRIIYRDETTTNGVSWAGGGGTNPSAVRIPGYGGTLINR